MSKALGPADLALLAIHPDDLAGGDAPRASAAERISALETELATALGELGVAREVLRRRGHEQECPEFDFDSEPDCCTCGWTAALDAPAGALAREVLRAAVKAVKVRKSGRVVMAGLVAAVDAFLAAYPEFSECS